MSDDDGEFPVRAILAERVATRGSSKRPVREYLVAWENSWVRADTVSGSTENVGNLEIVGITKDSDQKHIRKASFVVCDKTQQNAELRIWSYKEMREKAPELLLDFYEDQCSKQ